MRIALITDGITPYVLGGMQRHSFNLAKYLAQNNVEVDLYSFNKSKYDIEKLEFFTALEKANINLIEINFPVLDKFPGHYVRESYRYSELIFEDIKSKLDQYKFIYAKGFTAWKLIKEKKKGLKCPPIGVNFHGYEMFQPALDFKTQLNCWLLQKPVLFNVLNADFVFSYGSKITEIILKIGVKQSKILELPTGIDSSWITTKNIEPNDPIKLLFVGRYERRKGIEELSEAFEFIGPIPEEKKVVSEKIIYHGSISDAEKIKAILQQADVLICPSYSEGMPNVILEAMASGLAVVATNVGAVDLMVNKKNGWLMPKVNINTLVNTLKEVCAIDKQQLNEKRQQAVQTVKGNFLWEIIIKELIKKMTESK